MVYNSLSQHLLILEDQNGRRTIALEEIKYSIGRRSDNQIMIYSTQASRYHATLVRKTNSNTQGYSYWLLDGNLEGYRSQNGIYINGEKCLVHELKDNDLINFGCDVNGSYHQLSNLVETQSSNSLPSIVTTENNYENPRLLNAKVYQKSDYLYSTVLENTSISEDTIAQKTYLDPLTKLPNLSLFNEHFSLAINNAKKNNKSLAILLIEIENLVKITQKTDAKVKDELIQLFSVSLKDSLRSGDIVARLQEDKFVILIPQINLAEDANTIAQRLLDNIKKPLEIKEQTFWARSNIGIAIYPRDGLESKTLIDKAAFNLESIKQDKYRSTLIQKSTVHNHNTQFLQIENLLYEAIENEEFLLYYQPQISVKTGEIIGVEALLRWQHPKYGLIPPGKFLSIASKADLLILITQWVLQTACQQNKDWIQSGLLSLPISVNIFAQQFQSPYLIKMLTQVIAKTGLDANLLEIEITENCILENFADSIEIFQSLQEIDVNVSIDDFGIGYVSLGYLSQLPIKKLKIAQTLIQELKQYPQRTALVSAIIVSGQLFNWQVVAEGVETQQQLELLQALKCELMQGNRFSQPLAAREATQFLSLHQTLIGDCSV